MSSVKGSKPRGGQVAPKKGSNKTLPAYSSGPVVSKPKTPANNTKKDIKVDQKQESIGANDSLDEDMPKLLPVNNRKRKANELPEGGSSWKRVKVSDDIALTEGGFFMLEEIHFDGDVESNEYQQLIRAIPIKPAPLDETPIVDTQDEDLELDDADPEEEKRPKKLLKITKGTETTSLATKSQPKQVEKKEEKKTQDQAKKTKAVQSHEKTKVQSQEKVATTTKEKKQTQKESASESKSPVKSTKSVLEATEVSKATEPSETIPEAQKEEEDAFLEDDNDDDNDDEVEKTGETPARKYPPFVAQEELDDVDIPNWTSIYPLHKRILMGLNDLGYEQPTKIQQSVLPVALGKRLDVIGASQTGSGKTLSFGLPIVHQILELREKTHRLGQPRDMTIKALILSPTRELAIQIVEHLKNVSKHTDLRISPVVGGISITKQMRFLRKRPDILVATPGRLWEIISTGLMTEAETSLAHLRWLVFDEADKMVEFGRFSELSNILRTVYDSRRKLHDEQRTNNTEVDSAGTEEVTNNKKGNLSKNNEIAKKAQQVLGRPLQTFIFSATMSISPEARKNLKKIAKTKKESSYNPNKKRRYQETSETVNSEEMFEKLMEQIDFQREVELVDITTETHQVTTLEEAKIFCLHNEKDFYLYYFLTKYQGKSLIFVNAISNIKRLLPLMVILRIPAFGMHAQMEQHHRLKNLEKFKKTENAVLIATDVMARGLDIPQIDHVIHYSIPASAEVFVHRSGRTARAFATGLCISIVDPEDKRHYTSIMATLKRPEVPDFPVDLAFYSAAKKRVKVAAEMDSLSHEKHKKTAELDWLKAKAEELDAEIPEDLLSSDDEATVKKKAFDNQKKKIRYNQLKEQLRELLSQPMLGRGHSRTYVTKDIGAKLLEKPEKSDADTMDIDPSASEATFFVPKTPSQAHEKPSAIKDVIQSKSTTQSTFSTKMLDKAKQKRIVRLQSKRPLSGPLRK